MFCVFLNTGNFSKQDDDEKDTFTGHDDTDICLLFLLPNSDRINPPKQLENSRRPSVFSTRLFHLVFVYICYAYFRFSALSALILSQQMVVLCKFEISDKNR